MTQEIVLQLTDRQLAILRCALYRWSQSMRDHADIALQRGQAIYNNPDEACEAFIKDAEDAEQLRELLSIGEQNAT